MGLIDDLKKWAHPYEDEDEEYEDDFAELGSRDTGAFADERPSRRERLIDFLSGVAYAGEGKIKKVAANTYIITPYHVDIMGDLIDELENNGLYL